MLASKLSANPRIKVLLIEAGGDAPWYSWIPLVAPILQGGSYDWRLRTVPQSNAQGALNNRVRFPSSFITSLAKKGKRSQKLNLSIRNPFGLGGKWWEEQDR